MPRLFTAIELPASVVGALALTRGGIVGARWLEPADYHATLRFIGDVDARMAREVAESLDAIRRAPLALAFDGLGWFGGDKPRAIVAKVKPTPALVALQAEQERRLRQVGLDPEKRKFLPHVTLARLKGVWPGAVADYLNSRGALPALTFTATRFVLYSARDGVGGGPYVVEAAYALG